MTYFLAFTDVGFTLAQRLANTVGGTAERCGCPHSLDEWTRIHFKRGNQLVFVGAVGIAVRAIAAYVSDKTRDPAVVVLDECAQFAIPVLSGHLGGANDLARQLATVCNAIPVITTATDVHGIWAVDEWARHQHCAVLHPKNIHRVSGALLRGEEVTVASDFSIAGAPPKGVVLTQNRSNCNVFLGFTQPPESVLWLVPRCIVLGVGCRRGTPEQNIAQAFNCLQLPSDAVCSVASIDLKAKEPGLLSYCKTHGWQLQTYTAAELASLIGTFSSSDFVFQTTGVDNVCERAAVYAAGSDAVLLHRKTVFNGVTLAAAYKPFVLDWSWQDEP